SIETFSFVNDAPNAEIYTLSLHDALPISSEMRATRISPFGAAAMNLAPRIREFTSSTWKPGSVWRGNGMSVPGPAPGAPAPDCRSEEHTSELQSRENLVCRLLLEKKKNVR